MLSGRVVGFGDERDICSVVYCSGTKARREVIQNEAGNCYDLDFTKVSSQKNISALLCYFIVSVDTILASGSRHP